MTSEEYVIGVVTGDPERVAVLKAVAECGLPETWIAGGYIRNPIWDSLFKSKNLKPGSDVDVVYFKRLDTYGMSEKELTQQILSNKPNPVWEEELVCQRRLESLFPHLEFEVKNQARMHLSPVRVVAREKYATLADAVADWVETATATGVRVHNEVYEVLAPYGLNDLLNGIVRPTKPEFEPRARERAEKKGWFVQWPELTFMSS